MVRKIKDQDKALIISRFQQAKKNVVGVISKLESDCNWQGVHKQITIAIQELRQATSLLVKRHMEICVIERREKLHQPVSKRDIEEIIKSYKYLN